MYKIILLFSYLFIAGCSFYSDSKNDYIPAFSKDPNHHAQDKIIRFGVHPLHNPERLNSYFGPIVDILNQEIPEYHFQLESSLDYESFNKKIEEKRLDLILPNPLQTLLAIKNGYRVFAKMGDDENFHGLILVRKDSSIKDIKDLKGKKISFPAKTALAAAIMPQYYLQKMGLNLKKDYQVKYVGSQESSIISAQIKQTDAGATWGMAWDSMKTAIPYLESDMKIIFKTPNLINNSLMIKESIPSDLEIKIKKVFLQLINSENGIAILNKMKLSKFENANNDLYIQKVNDFYKKYEKEFGIKLGE